MRRLAGQGDAIGFFLGCALIVAAASRVSVTLGLLVAGVALCSLSFLANRNRAKK